ncbi:MAG: hypothetical protein IKD69_01765 [Solobacterium sp.]|nr:hypothetical protein [Solobacterium sp.]
MEYVGFIFGIFGLMAYLQVSSLKSRVDALEQQLSKVEGTDYAMDRAALQRIALNLLHKPILLDLKEDHEDVDLYWAQQKKGSCTLTDADNDWLLIHLEYGKTVKDKLIRLESVRSITAITEQ